MYLLLGISAGRVRFARLAAPIGAWWPTPLLELRVWAVAPDAAGRVGAALPLTHPSASLGARARLPDSRRDKQSASRTRLRRADPLFDAAGGMPFFESLVDRFYEGVASDPRSSAVYPEPTTCRAPATG